jgi:DNA-binding SARP family transcriptional activator/tetratricopeptide (TPR) repeat protein
MDFRILGPLEVVGEAGPIALPRGRGRALLALLVLRAREVVTAERLIDELWGQSPPPTVNKSLHNLVSDLRRRLGAGTAGGARESVLATSGAGYVLQVDEEQVDASRFRRLLEEASRGQPEERAARLRAALRLWRGPALADFAYEPFAQADIAVLEELRLGAVEERIDADLVLGRHAAAVGELEGLVAAQPFREHLRAQLMLALYRCGRQADALVVYQAGRRALLEDLGIEPGPVLGDLERAILRQDPALELSAPPAGDAAALAPRTAAEPWLVAERKTVTVVYVELVEPTTTAGDADPEVVRRALTRSVGTASTILDRHGGTVEGFIGGVIVAVFGVPTAREDDALRAARAVVELREATASLPDRGLRLAARIGVNTGEVVLADAATGLAAASGDAVKLAARLQQAAAEDEVLIGEATRQLLGDGARVESVATVVPDRRGRPATVWRLVGLTPDASVGVPDRSPTLIGRDGELGRLHAAVQDTRRERRASRFTVTGEPGVGKSRLAQEFVGTLGGEVDVLLCRCPAYGEGITFWPLRELVLQAAGDGGLEGITALLAGHEDAVSVAERVAGAIGLGDPPESDREVFAAVRRLLETLARRRPVVIVVDDAHWAQPAFLDLLDFLAEAVRAPLLIICIGRPELVDHRRWWPEGAAASSLVLEPLPPDDSERLVVDRLAGRIVPDDVVTQVVDQAQGNPLYIEQLLAALRDEGKLRFPPSVHALLAARLERLGPAERDLLRCASVVGADFSPEALAALVPDRVHRFLGRHLDALQRRELIHPSRRTFPGGRAFAFRHALIQQAAYRSMTLEARAALHEQLAEWLERGDEKGQLEELVAHHLEQAHALRRRLGPQTPATRDLALRAGERLARAGLRAYRRFDMAAAEQLLSRARTLLPAGHPGRYDVLRRLSEAYPALGRLSDGEAVLAEMLDDPRAHDDARMARRLRLEQLRIRLIAGPDPVPQDSIRAEVERILEVLEPLEDHVGMSQACYLLAAMYLRSGRIRALEEIGRRGLEHARRSGDLREQLGALWWPSWALVAGPTPVVDAIGACERLLHLSRGQHIGVMTDLARLAAMLGEFDEARDLAQRARRQALERVRVRRALTVLGHRTAEVEILAGDLDAAERTLRPAMEIALDVGERDQTSQIVAELSGVLSARGAAHEGATLAAVSRQQAPAESVAAQALWRAATARARAADADTGEATRLLRESLELIPPEMLNLRADLCLRLAEVLRETGSREAASARRAAIDLYERKGNVVGAASARRLGEGARARP